MVMKLPNLYSVAALSSVMLVLGLEGLVLVLVLALKVKSLLTSLTVLRVGNKKTVNLHDRTCSTRRSWINRQASRLPAMLDVCYTAFTPGHIFAGYKLLVRDTCGLYLGDIITIHLRHGRLVSSNRRTRNWRQFCRRYKIGYMLTATSGYKWIRLVSDNMS